MIGLFIALAAAAEAPCDILAAAGNTCVAAHSTVRALYAAYSGPLYEIARTDGRMAIVGVLGPGGFANITAQEGFCVAGDCVIRKVYDQSPEGNHLTQRISCVPGQGCVYHKMVSASKHRIAVRGGTEVFGMWFDPGHGYNVDVTTGVAKGNEPESIYAVMSGTHYNANCCFDYGNSENSENVPWRGGAGAMEAIYFGSAAWNGNTGNGTGPWVGADLEAGMYYGGGAQTIVNNRSQPLTSDFVSLHLKGRPGGFALKGGDAAKGPLVTTYDGVRPDPRLAKSHQSYQPMQKQGAIVLGTGGDNSNGAEGNFYEGYIATGVTSAATDDAIQANIIAVGYATLPTPAPTPPPPVTALGCYVDNKDRDLPVAASSSLADADAVTECSLLCAGYKFFALEYGKECHCGNAYGKYGKAADPAADCNMPCDHDPSVMCGGLFFENVYSH